MFLGCSGNVSEIFRCERAKANDLKSARDCLERSLNIPKRSLNIPKHSLNIPKHSLNIPMRASIGKRLKVCSRILRALPTP
jgi:hypothetical protein